MNNNIIAGIIYSEMNNIEGPNPLVWIPSTLDDDTVMSVAIKTITLLTTDRGIIPEELVVVPFPALGLKSIIKYIEKDDPSSRGSKRQSAICLLFNEFDDIIFYKYSHELEIVFNEIGDNIILLEEKEASNDLILKELSQLKEKIISIIEQLSLQESNEIIETEFPEVEKDLSKASEFVFKIVIIGDPEVGKTSLILRFTDNAFNRKYLPTLGVNVCEKNISIDDHNAQFLIWDIAGQLKFKKMRKHFYQGADGVVIVFDLAKRKSFENVKNWYEDIKNILSQREILGTLVGNKKDLTERVVSKEEAEVLAIELGVEYIETSAKTGENVQEIFKKMARLLLQV
ncbi:MAG: Rab family GTPase [Promethearchaeota archaeon]